MEIKTKRLTLRPIGMADLETQYAYTSDYENTKYMMFLPDESIEETKAFLKRVEAEWKKEKPAVYEFAILYENTHVGGVGIDLLDKGKTAEFGWSLNKKYWRKGICYEAAAAVLEYAVNQLGIKHFIAHCDSENVASYKVMEKLGMKRVDCYGGRKNKGSDEERMELRYEMWV